MVTTLVYPTFEVISKPSLQIIQSKTFTPKIFFVIQQKKIKNLSLFNQYCEMDFIWNNILTCNLKRRNIFLGKVKRKLTLVTWHALNFRFRNTFSIKFWTTGANSLIDKNIWIVVLAPWLHIHIIQSILTFISQSLTCTFYDDLAYTKLHKLVWIYRF